MVMLISMHLDENWHSLRVSCQWQVHPCVWVLQLVVCEGGGANCFFFVLDWKRTVKVSNLSFFMGCISATFFSCASHMFVGTLRFLFFFLSNSFLHRLWEKLCFIHAIHLKHIFTLISYPYIFILHAKLRWLSVGPWALPEHLLPTLNPVPECILCGHRQDWSCCLYSAFITQHL